MPLDTNALRRLGFGKRAAAALAAQFSANTVSDGAPAVPNAKDDEFAGTTSAVWTDLPTPAATWSVNSDFPGVLHLRAAGSASAYVGKTQPVPAGYPFTIVTKISGYTARANFHRGGGILLAPAGALTGTSNILYFGPVYDTTNASGLTITRVSATAAGTFGSQTVGPRVGIGGPFWLKAVVASATSVTLSASMDGRVWFTVDSALNPGFTPGVMGLAAAEETALGGVDAVFDFFRVS